MPGGGGGIENIFDIDGGGGGGMLKLCFWDVVVKGENDKLAP